MPTYKKLINFDEQTLQIVTKEPTKKHSEFVRKAVNFYELNKNIKFETPIITKGKNLRVKL